MLQPTNGATIGESGGEGFSNGPINQVLPPHDHDHQVHGDDDNQVLPPHDDDDDDANDKCSNLPN